MTFVKSDIDNRFYMVRNLDDKQVAANLLSYNRNKIIDFYKENVKYYTENTLGNNLNKFIGIPIPNTSNNIFIPVYCLFVNKNNIIFNLKKNNIYFAVFKLFCYSKTI